MSDYRDREGVWHGLEAERGKVYGDPLTNHRRIAALWSQYLGVPVLPSDVAECMALVKDSRLMQTPDHGDSLDDRAVYRDFRDRFRAAGE